MDQRALWLGSTFAAAKLALALWAAQLAVAGLDRRRATLAWRIALALATIAAAWWTMPTAGVPSWWRGAWLANGMLAAATLVDCVRRWLSTAAADAVLLTQRIQWLLAASGLALSAVAIGLATDPQLPRDWLLRTAAPVYLVSAAGLLGIAIAVSLELTLGALGAKLLELNWRTIRGWATLCWLPQVALNVLIVLSGQVSESPLEAAAPFLFAFGMLVVGYIAWANPRRMVQLQQRGTVQGQASLAVAGWLAVLCLAIATGLPPAWPWAKLGKPSARFAAFAVVEQ